MGKKDKKKKKGFGVEKTTAKTDKKLIAKQKKLLQKLGEDDIENIVSSFQTSNALETAELLCAPPSSRTNFSICSFDDIIYIFGGEFFNGNKTDVFGNFFTFNTIKNEWKQINASPTPTPRSGHQMIVSAQNGGEFYLFGGEFASPSQLQYLHFRDLWRFQLKTKKWEKLNAPNGPSARSGHRMVLTKKRIILFGGFHDNNNSYQYFNDVYCFSLESYNWTKLETSGIAPSPRSGVIMGATEDGKVIITGGYTKTSAKSDAERGITHNDSFMLQEVDGGKWKWSNIKPGGRRPAPRSAVACTSGYGGRIYTFGGVMDTEEDDENLRGQFSNEIHFLDTSGGGLVWRKVEIKPRKSEQPQKSSNEEVMEVTPIKTTTDGVFTVTVGGAAPSKQTSVEQHDYIDVGGPSPRMNAGIVLVRHNLYVFGGSYEQGNRLFTLCDFYSLDINKTEAWRTHIGNLPSLTWFGSDSEDSSSNESEEDESDDEEDEGSADSDEMETDK
ncbi:CLUMA_CG000714, isoform A [Clunio marinus]|uniref:CLUMA_CG000714, isoform A n=1 Tax=Clunio marinus TaxID=568069 RepID=A0A1J1HKX6_9DIPT|nr:CLUMA_CG000714, isoform A [Clunio marinus]